MKYGKIGVDGESMKQTQESKSPKSPAAFARLIGSNPIWSADPILQRMLHKGYPITLKTYLGMGHAGKSLDELHPEDRGNLPEFLLPKT